jgi:prepilin-type N-terminal cleavage/methylation domain-containing protein
MNNKNKHSQGFTLLETLVSIGVIAVVGVLIAQVFFTTTRSNTKTELLKDVKQNGEFSVEIMGRMIRNSMGIANPCSAAGTEYTSLDLENSDGDTTRIECQFDTVAAVTRIASSSATTGTSYLTNSNVTLGGASCADTANSLHFTCVSFPDQPSKITIQFSLSQRGTPVDQFERSSMVFQSTVSPRN